MATAKTGNRPYSSRPKTGRSSRGNAGDATFDAPTAAERRRMDEEQSRPYREAYEAGEKAGKETAKKGSGSKSGKGKGRGSSAKRRRPVPGARSARTAARQLQAPVRTQVTSGLRVVGIAMGIVVLYNILTTPGPEAFSGVLGGLSRALQWFSQSNPIPARK